MPASLSKLKDQNDYSSTNYERCAWYIKSKDNPKNIVDTPNQQELKQWKKAVNQIHKTRKEIREECQQSSLNCITKKTSS